MDDIRTNIESIDQQIRNAESKYGRSLNSVLLLPVSKGQQLNKIQQAYDLGIRRFGENYLREALVKISALRGCNIEWHFIGLLQSHKTKAIAENFSWVQTVYKKKHAERLNEQRPRNLPALNICLQINLDEEKTKAGIKICK